VKFKEYENSESTYWGVDLSAAPDSKEWNPDIEVEAIKDFEYITVNGYTDRNNIRVWRHARVRWRGGAWGFPDETMVFAEKLRTAWCNALGMDHKHGLIK
jgi:hypothetical protein